MARRLLVRRLEVRPGLATDRFGPSTDRFGPSGRRAAGGSRVEDGVERGSMNTENIESYTGYRVIYGRVRWKV